MPKLMPAVTPNSSEVLRRVQPGAVKLALGGH